MDETNETLQTDEIQALSAIFEDEWTVEDSTHRVYSIAISNKAKNSVHLQVTFPESYPLNSPPIYQISAPWMNRVDKKSLCSAIEDVYSQNIGKSIVYLWIETIKNFIDESSFNSLGSVQDLPHLDEALLESELAHNLSKLNEFSFDELPPIEHGEPIIDRKSVFQAHVAKVISIDQVNQVLQKLKENGKIASATHNIFAYRISQGDSKIFIQDYDDDGESKAGSLLLRLLQIVNASDVLVVVSRWYGGIHLGPDRFKHINNVARNLLSKLGFIAEKSQETTKKSKKS